MQLKTFHKRLTLESDRLEIFAVSHFYPEQHDLIVCRLIYNNISLKNVKNKKKKNNKNNLEQYEDNDNEDDEINDSDDYNIDIDENKDTGDYNV